MNYTQYYRVAVISALLVTGVLAQDMMKMTTANLSDMCLYQSSWSQQLKNAMTVNGGELEGAFLQVSPGL